MNEKECPCGVPPQLKTKIQEWLDANKKHPCEVRYGSFPLGMVQGWIERAQEAEAELIAQKKCN